MFKLIYKINVIPIAVLAVCVYVCENWSSKSEMYMKNKGPWKTKKSVNCRSNVLEEVHDQISG